MCGLAGIIRLHPPGNSPPAWISIPEPWLDVLDASIVHRGPDGAGRFRDRMVLDNGSTLDAALVHRRLSIIDHSGGRQPMVLARNQTSDLALTTHPDRVLADPIGNRPEGIASFDTGDHEGIDRADLTAVVFNGCIYNHRTLRAQLEALGCRFQSDHSDTEVLVHGLRQWGPQCFERCEGMYAVAAWRHGQLILARDAFGEKPLYWCCQSGVLAFASTATALARLMCLLPGGLNIREEGMVGWLADGYRLGHMGLMDIQEVMPGQVLVFDSPRADPTRHRSQQLNATPRPDTLPRTGSALLDHIETEIERAVAMRLEADVPLACFLSGGVDSSIIAMMARRHVDRLETVCVRMPAAEFDESAHARLVAQTIGSAHIEVEVCPSPAHDLVNLIGQLGLPFADSSLLPAHWASSAIAGGVALGGDGGDELFLGYERQWASQYLAKPWSLMSRILSPAALAVLDRSNPRSRADKAARLLAASRCGSYRELVAIMQRADVNALLRRSVTMDSVDEPCTEPKGAQHFDLNVYLPGDLMRKTDTASMACPIEVRSPYLDRTLAASVLPLSAGVLGGPSGRERKGLLRAIARRHLPAEVIDRPKQGFAIPIGAWFRSDFGSMRQCLYDHLDRPEPFGGLDSGLIDRGCVQRWLREHDHRRRDHSQRLFALLSLSVWCKQVTHWRT